MPTMSNRLREWARHSQPDLLRIAWLARYELSSVWIDLRGRCTPRQRALLKRLKQEKGLKLHFASGPYKRDGWINVDGAAEADVQLDLRRPFPFATESVRLIFAEHFLDHLQFPDVVGRFLSECHRVLEPSGRIRLVLHDAELLAKAYLARDQEFFRLALNSQPPFAESVNELFRHNGFHQFIYDFETLELVLRRAGFTTVLRSSCAASEIPELNLDWNDPHRSVQSLYVEAIKAS
ncbi:MAG: Methyltransferase domain protein [Myxococcaceae bacterium]|nr:Methyltransferase domain protein [Myxococcaceae bacterium]